MTVRPQKSAGKRATSSPAPLCLGAAVGFPTDLCRAAGCSVFHQLIEWEMFVNAGGRDLQPALNESLSLVPTEHYHTYIGTRESR